MKIKRAVMFAVLVLAVAALVVPLMGFKARAAGSAADARAPLSATKANAAAVTGAVTAVQPTVAATPAIIKEQSGGAITPETLAALGIKRLPKGKLASATAKAANQIAAQLGQRPIVTPRPSDGRISATVAPSKLAGPPLVG